MTKKLTFHFRMKLEKAIMKTRKRLTDLETPLSVHDICLILGISYRYALRLAQKGLIEKQGGAYTVLSVQSYIRGLRLSRRSHNAARAAKKRSLRKKASFWDLSSSDDLGLGPLVIDQDALGEEIRAICSRLNTGRGRHRA